MTIDLTSGRVLPSWPGEPSVPLKHRTLLENAVDRIRGRWGRRVVGGGMALLAALVSLMPKNIGIKVDIAWVDPGATGTAAIPRSLHFSSSEWSC